MPDTSQELHVVFGTGPLGLATMRVLRAAGKRVRMINRSARVDFDKDLQTEVGGGDAADPRLTREVCEGAAVVYHCVGLPYPRWREFPAIARGIVEGTASAGAKLVYGDNLYAYGPVRGPIYEGLPPAARTVKGRIRAEAATLMLDAHAAGKIRLAVGRASDFFGPGVGDNSMLGSRVFARLLAEKPAQVIGDPDRLHSYTYIEDFARALVLLGERNDALGQVWHVPTVPATSTRHVVEHIARIAGVAPKVSALPGWLVGLAGLFNGQVRELKELLYEFEEGFVLDSSRFEQTFGVAPTPLETALRATVDWYRRSR